ncbi:MAG: type II toxin-antitoxin system RelE/ParE family toxin [Candidatus Marinimicrobia bacterium]|nr:type II toxin-antitoxin system RelE/ParE family toxin [Candidatus Neomarinimicrobiota bacterium]
MKKPYSVLWTDVAENDLIGIIDYIAEEDPGAALKIMDKIRRRTNSLFNLPERGRIVRELSEQGISGYHELIVSPWRIIYKIEDNKVLVLSVLDSRRNVEDILLRRLIQIRC